MLPEEVGVCESLAADVGLRVYLDGLLKNKLLNLLHRALVGVSYVRTKIGAIHNFFQCPLSEPVVHTSPSRVTRQAQRKV